MTTWARGFAIGDVAEVHYQFRRAIVLAERNVQLARRGLGPPATATLAEIQRAYAAFQTELREVAVLAAAEAQRGIEQRLRDTQVRSDTGTSPHLRDLIVCKPAPQVLGYETGAVNVASVNALDRAVNRNTPGYGTYWRAQEYGTGSSEVPSQIGRVIHGVFTGPRGGDATPPISEYAGGGGPHPVFLPSSRGNLPTALGRKGGGFGTIGYEIRARHFIRFGADEAAVRWRSGLARVQEQAIARLLASRAP